MQGLRINQIINICLNLYATEQDKSLEDVPLRLLNYDRKEMSSE